MSGGAVTPLQGSMLAWQGLLDKLRGLSEREQEVLLDILCIALAREVGRRLDVDRRRWEAA